MSSAKDEALTGSLIIARTLKALHVQVIFGIVGIPVVEVAEACIAQGIRFISFRNEQAASYAASAYGYLTGRPGVLLVVGGPGVLHAIAVMGGSNHTTQTTMGAFQELDAISFLKPHTKLAVRPPNAASIPIAISDAYRMAFYGRPGPTFVDFPADLIQGKAQDLLDTEDAISRVSDIPAPPQTTGDPERIKAVAQLLKNAERPLVIIGKGACYSQNEVYIRDFVESTNLPFLPTPMGKGLLPDSHPLNTSSARSLALSSSDVIIVLGARLNWILHYGSSPKFSPIAVIVQVDILPEEIGHNSGNAAVGIVGDAGLVASDIHRELGDSWRYSPGAKRFQKVKEKNEKAAEAKAAQSSSPMKYHEVFGVVKRTLDGLSPPENGDIVYVSEGANTMDISRSVFTVSHPRHRLDAGTYGTMGVGLGYAIAAHVAYEGSGKKIIAIEGDSAFGFSMAEIETLVRYQMGVVIYVMNNSGVYSGTADEDYAEEGGKGLKSTALGREVRYDIVAQGLGAKGILVRTPEELAKATEEGFKETNIPTLINVIIDRGLGTKIEFNWNKSEKNAKL